MIFFQFTIPKWQYCLVDELTWDDECTESKELGQLSLLTAKVFNHLSGGLTCSPRKSLWELL